MTSVPPLPEELRSSRLVLRPYRAEDAAAVFAAIEASRARLRRWMPWVDAHRTPDDSRAFCLRAAANWADRAQLFLGIFDHAGTFLGSTGLNDPDWELRRFEVGYWLRNGAEGHGYAREAVRMQARFAFEELAARRFELRCDPRNARSRRVAEALGFPLEGRLRNEQLAPDGQPRDTLVFALIPEDYARLVPTWGE